MHLAALASAFAVILSSPAARTTDPSAPFQGAQRVDSLEPFLASYVGHCTDPYERRACEANVAQVRKAAAGKTYVVRISDGASLIRLEHRGDDYVLLLTPFIDGGGLALTHGAPAKQDPQGRPLMPFIPIPAAVPAGMMDLDFEGPFRTGSVELEIAFQPQKTWKLSRRGEGLYEGMAARFLAVRVLNARTGEEIASKAL